MRFFIFNFSPPFGKTKTLIFLLIQILIKFLKTCQDILNVSVINLKYQIHDQCLRKRGKLFFNLLRVLREKLALRLPPKNVQQLIVGTRHLLSLVVPILTAMVVSFGLCLMYAPLILVQKYFFYAFTQLKR